MVGYGILPAYSTFAGRLPDSLRNCVNKDFFSSAPGPQIVNPVQQWAIDSHNAPAIPHPQPSIPQGETNHNGTGYRFPNMPAVSNARSSSGNEIGPPDSINPTHRGLPVSSIAPGSGLMPSVHSTRPSSASPVVVNRQQSPQPVVGGKTDGEMPHKD